jgi:hypothetical protein
VLPFLLALLAFAAVLYLYLALSRFFTERAFMSAYRRAMQGNASHATALRAALGTFEHRPPFNALSQAELDCACQMLSVLFDARAVARLVRQLDRARDARLLANEAFLRGVVLTYSWLPR